MPTGTLSTIMSVAGTALQQAPIVETGDQQQSFEITLPAGEAGTVLSGGTTTSGVLTITGHSLSNTDVIDIYWVGGARFGVTIDTSDSNTVTFDDTPPATGDSLPVDTTAIVATLRINVNVAIDGDNVQMFGIGCGQRCQCQFYDSGDAVIKQYDLQVANAVETYYQSSAEANPLTGNPITYAMASNGTITAATLTILSLEDSTP